MSYASTGDGNLAALQKYEEKIEKNERNYAAFETEIEDLKIEERLQELLDEFNSVSEKYGIMEDFDEYFAR
jgi:hypothetical protein